MLSEVDELLQCGRCEEIYQEAKILPCGIFCSKCVNDLLSARENGKFICSLCNETHSVPDKGFKPFTRFIKLKSMVKSLIPINEARLKSNLSLIDKLIEKMESSLKISSNLKEENSQKINTTQNEIDSVLNKIEEFNVKLTHLDDYEKEMINSLKNIDTFKEIQTCQSEIEICLKKFENLGEKALEVNLRAENALKDFENERKVFFNQFKNETLNTQLESYSSDNILKSKDGLIRSKTNQKLNSRRDQKTPDKDMSKIFIQNSKLYSEENSQDKMTNLEALLGANHETNSLNKEFNLETNPFKIESNLVTDPLNKEPNLEMDKFNIESNLDTDPIYKEYNLQTNPFNIESNLVTDPFHKESYIEMDLLNKEPNIVTDPLNKEPYIVTDPIFKDCNLETDPIYKESNLETDPFHKESNLETDPIYEVSNLIQINQQVSDNEFSLAPTDQDLKIQNSHSLQNVVDLPDNISFNCLSQLFEPTKTKVSIVEIPDISHHIHPEITPRVIFMMIQIYQDHLMNMS